jgi:predicted RecB family nuclease
MSVLVGSGDLLYCNEDDCVATLFVKDWLVS